jgi:hypothetical protein
MRGPNKHVTDLNFDDQLPINNVKTADADVDPTGS